jgi:5-formyltetrahydrofolate cyclo-ligase
MVIQDNPGGDRRQLRREMRQKRRSLTPQQRRHAANSLARHLITSPLFIHRQRIAAYLTNDGEIDPLPLLLRALYCHKSIYLPILAPQQRLWFGQWRTATLLTPNRYGIPEPATPACAITQARQLDLILLPLVAFDDHGHRLGMGGGYYDRTLAWLQRHPHAPRPRLIGLAYEFQRQPLLTVAPWDIPLDAIATEVGIHHITAPRSREERL